MRNLKKALALVLALMMALSLMSFASAADYADDSAIAQDEAVSVMSALGVFNGTDGGNFDPDGTLTRAQAAKIITYMLLGQEVADSLPNTGSKFADCPDGRWYVGSVNYLTDLGIVAGRSETIFDPNKTVNGYEFAKMLLGALGYDSKTEKFEGDSGWSLNIATLARRAGLNEDLAVSVISTAPLTREQAAKLSFNTLKATMVYYEGGVSVGDVTVNPTRKEVSNAASNHYDTTAAGDTLMQFCEQYFPELKYQAYAEADDFGHTPDGRWMNGRTPAYVNLADPTLVLTDAVSEADLIKKLPKGAALKNNSVTPKKNGADDTAVTTMAGLAALTGNGKKVEIYVDGDNKIDAIITTVYTVESVKNIVEKNGETTYTFSSTGGSYKNNEDATNAVVSGTVAKGDVVTTVKIGDKIYVYATDKFTGNQTAKKGNTVTIGGAEYVIATGVTGVSAGAFTNSKDEANYWADMNGYLVKVDGITTQVDINYALITRAIVGSSTPSLDNPTSYTMNVRAVLDNGDVMDATLKIRVATAAEASELSVEEGDVLCGNVKVADKDTVIEAGVNGFLAGKMFGYYIKDGKMVLDKVDFNANITKDSVYGFYMADNYDGATSHNGADKSGASGPNQTSIKALFNSKTVFVLYTIDGTKVTAKAVTGTAGLSIDDTDGGLAIITANSATQGTASVVFLQDNTVAPTVDYVYIDKATESNVLHGDKDVYAYTGIAADGGSDTHYTSDKTQLTKSGLYVYDGDKVIGAAKVEEDAAAATGTPAAGDFKRLENAQTNDDLILVGDAWVRTTADTQTYLASGVESVAGSNCFVVMKDANTVAAIFAYATYEAPKPAIAATIPATAQIANDANTAEISVTSITAGATYTITAVGKTDADKAAVTAAVEGAKITFTRVGDAPENSAGDKTVTFVVTVTPTGDSANDYSAETGEVAITLKAANA